MIGMEISVCGLPRIVFLRPTMLGEGSGDGEAEVAGELRTETMLEDNVVEVLRSVEEPLAMSWREVEWVEWRRRGSYIDEWK